MERKKAIGIVPQKVIKTGDRIAIDIKGIFEEKTILSMQINKKDVRETPPGSDCGIVFEGDVGRLREKIRVFLIKQ